MGKYIEVNAKGGGLTSVLKDGVVVSQHSEDREVSEAMINLQVEFPESEIEAISSERWTSSLTAAGRAKFINSAPDPEPEPTPEPTPDPEPVPVPEPDPSPVPPPPVSWSMYRGIPDPSAALGFDVYADYPADEVLTGNIGTLNITKSGTPAKPYVVDVRNATFTKYSVSGSYVIVDGGTIQTNYEGPVRVSGSHVVTRDMNVGGVNGVNFGHGAACTLGNFNVWLRGSVHNFGILGPDAPEQDQHGFKVQSDDVWILDVETYGLSGDGVQVGDASRGDAKRVYIGGGHYHDNRENGVDIKDSTDVVVSSVRMTGFAAVSSSHGEAIVIHDDAFNAKIYDNTIRDTALGIVSSGKSGHVIDGNDIVATSVGIQLRNTRPVTVTNNEIIAPVRVQKQGGLNAGDNIQS